MTQLWQTQQDALSKMRNGCILYGGVGSGKSITAIAYWQQRSTRENVVIITTAMKRDSLEWQKDLASLGLWTKEAKSHISIDSWNRIGEYVDRTGCLFIFDEQKLVGSGAWVKAFLKIAEKNDWILLSGTPGDTWMDYVPVFLANGFYRNRTEFNREHIVFNRFTKYPKVDRYIGERKLEALRAKILVPLESKRKTVRHIHREVVDFDRDLYEWGTKNRFDTFKQEPLRDAGALCYWQRKVVNSSRLRYERCLELCEKHPRVIIFYNFDYELDELRSLGPDLGRVLFERNGHKHDRLNEDLGEWIYLVQYNSGAEAWNCITTNAMIFYSQTYSWKIREQAMGRIDRVNTVYRDLHYYELMSPSSIDVAIRASIERKKVFNEKTYTSKMGLGL